MSTGASEASPESLDIRRAAESDGSDEVSILTSPDRADPQSPLWLGLVRPFGWGILGLVAVVIVIPFVVIAAEGQLDAEVRVEKLLTWATHVLAPVVGFASTVVAYFFGTRSAQRFDRRDESDDQRDT